LTQFSAPKNARQRQDRSIRLAVRRCCTPVCAKGLFEKFTSGHNFATEYATPRSVDRDVPPPGISLVVRFRAHSGGSMLALQMAFGGAAHKELAACLLLETAGCVSPPHPAAALPPRKQEAWTRGRPIIQTQISTGGIKNPRRILGCCNTGPHMSGWRQDSPFPRKRGSDENFPF